MVGTDFIELHNLTIEELSGVVNLSPWYGAARKELCRRMAKTSGDSWGEAQFADMALYVADRKKISSLVRASRTVDYSDKDVERLLQSFIAPEEEKKEEKPQVRVVGGDFFSQAEYDNVKNVGEGIFSKFAFQAKKEPAKPEEGEPLSEAFCTEALAEIYADQGYPELAKRIYSKLSLVYPEKNAYFAALIEKLK